MWILTHFSIFTASAGITYFTKSGYELVNVFLLVVIIAAVVWTEREVK